MRLQVTTRDGITYGGRHYAQGEEFEVEDTWRGNMWTAAFLAKKQARKYEPVVVGTPTPPPRRAREPQQPELPKDTSVAPITTETMPSPDAAPVEPPGTHVTAGSWMQPSFEEKAEAPEDTQEESSDETATSRRRGRYARRDLRPEE